uniref:Uncharacterized protein n=1 Tax=Lactuca sativa TaxID=4236 RepID=A0A9R1UQG7_LACSA|nr:hypothetical protein LSAT_V11C800447430 [Lactuca sativa]
MTSSYYMSLQEYVYGERKSVPSPVRDHFRRQDESSFSMSSSGRSHGRGGRSGKPSLEEVLKRLHALEQHVFMNREPTEVLEDEGKNKNNTNENVCSDIEDDKNKFDDDVFDLNDDNEAKEVVILTFILFSFNRLKHFLIRNYCLLIYVSEEDDLIITGNINYYDDYGFDGKEVTPDRPRARNSSKYLCPPYTMRYSFNLKAYILHMTPKQKRILKKKVDIKSTSPVPPPAFAVVHDFSVLRLQPYVAGGEVVIHNYLFHSYNVQHRLYNLVVNRDFWSALFGHTHDGWLEATVK